MTVSVALKGSSQLMAALQRASGEIQEAAGRAVLATAVELRGDVVKRIQRGPASGRVYQKYSPRRVHQASAPGQAPMSDTGRLANSVTYEAQGPLTAAVGSPLVYAVYLEYGTRRMAPRPAWEPATEAMRAKFIKRLEAALAGAY